MIGVKACAVASGVTNSLWAVDPYWSSVVLAMPMNGADNSTTFTDLKGKTITRYGDAKISTVQSKFGGASAYFDGSGDYLEIASSTDTTLGTGDFTLECWIYQQSVPSSKVRMFLRQTNDPSRTVGFNLEFNTASKVGLFLFGNNTYDQSGTLSLNEWHHVAITRSGGVFRGFVDGVQFFSRTASNSFPAAPVLIGYDTSDAARAYLGYLDDLRITKGVARYTANFTPPIGL